MRDGEPPYTFGIAEDAAPEDVQAVWDGLADYNRAIMGRGEFAQLRIFLRDADGRIAGGLLGESYWGWLHIDIFWLRKQRAVRVSARSCWPWPKTKDAAAAASTPSSTR